MVDRKDNTVAQGALHTDGAAWQDWPAVHEAERAQLAKRRESRGRRTPSDAGHLADLAAQGPIGLALSGGGIRSAATCLGALQALQAKDRLEHFDYLSTVSGGGYIGATYSAAMSEVGGGRFPFGTDVNDSPVVGHLRNNSTYLFPRDQKAVTNLGIGLVVLLRGLIANAVVVAGPLLGLALVLRLAYPNTASLDDKNVILRVLLGIGRFAGLPPAATATWCFVFAFAAAILALLALLTVAVLRHRTASQVNGDLLLRLALSLSFGALVGLALCYQPASGATAPPAWSTPFLLPMLAAALLAMVLLAWALPSPRASLHHATKAKTPHIRTSDDVASRFSVIARSLLMAALLLLVLDLQAPAIAVVARWLNGSRDFDLGATWAALTALGGTALAGYSRLEKLLASGKRSQHLQAILTRGGAKLALYLAALVLPLALWLGFLIVCAWLIDGLVGATGPCLALRHLVQSIADVLHIAPGTILDAVATCESTTWRWGVALAACALATLCAALLEPNAYSLHGFYRDRLGRAFLVTETAAVPPGNGVAPPPVAQLSLDPKQPLRLSALAGGTGPYPIINAAINLRGSVKANQLGRNAGFFVFTPDYVGGDLTGYVATTTMEDAAPHLSLAAAIAISGAAFSANAGGNTIAPLAPSLALLNIRLGYALPNPLAWAQPSRVKHRLFRLFLLREMFGNLTECDETVHLTDGGHIENLGLYALLQRRCRFILAVDAEADAEYALESLLKLERYARIDLGVRIVLPWEEIAARAQMTKTALLTPGAARDKVPPREKGPHVAVGKIFYPPQDGSSRDDDKNIGILVYVKASLSGDEKDYILDYARRNPDFPHETTVDQNYSEEQFEMYRGLGFHMVQGIFDKDDLSVTANSDGFADATAARKAIHRWIPPKAPS